MKELENQVRYLGEANAALQYNSHMERQAWAEKEKALEAEIAGLKKRLLASSCDIRDLRSQLSTAAKSPS